MCVCARCGEKVGGKHAQQPMKNATLHATSAYPLRIENCMAKYRNGSGVSVYANVVSGQLSIQFNLRKTLSLLIKFHLTIFFLVNEGSFPFFKL